MDKMRMKSKDMQSYNVEKLAELFPEAVTEGIGTDGTIQKSINFEKLRELLSGDISDAISNATSNDREVYDFTWVGKRKAMIESSTPINKTLRPCKEESKNWDGTENLYIEGDNLDVLKLLQESYLNAVKMIYIDPPYNTGNDFIYRDDFKQSVDEYAEESGEYSEDGERLFKNTDTNGRFHSDWCSMIYSRLRIARNLLTDDGVIFISIDDNEVENLKKICNEVFGEGNFVAQLVWERAYAPKNDAKYVSNSHDYVLMYAKHLDLFQIGRLARTEESNKLYGNPDNDPRGIWRPDNLSVKSYSAACDYPITTPSGRVVEPPTGRCWRLSKNAFFERLADNRIWFGKDGNNVPAMKRFMSELKHEGLVPQSIMFYKNVGHSQEGSKEVTALLEAGAFDGPKPVRLLNHLLTLANTDKDSIILDFFSGSATTAHAVMQLNAEDGGKRKFIMVQLPEKTDEKSEAYRAGYKNICEIGKERVRRAGDKIVEELKKDKPAWSDEETHPLDIGFRVFKVDSSNMKDVYFSAAEYDQILLAALESNIKDDRGDLDLLFGCMLDWGLPLSMPYKSEKIGSFTIHTVNNGDLIACFDEEVSEEVVREIAKRKPLRALFRDSSFADSPARINVCEIFKTLAPSTTVKVI